MGNKVVDTAKLNTLVSVYSSDSLTHSRGRWYGVGGEKSQYFPESKVNLQKDQINQVDVKGRKWYGKGVSYSWRPTEGKK